MAKRDKRIAAMRRNPRHVTPEQMDAVLLAGGFVRRSGRGDHLVYDHPTLPVGVIIDPRRPHLLAYQVRQALAALDQISPE